MGLTKKIRPTGGWSGNALVSYEAGLSHNIIIAGGPNAYSLLPVGLYPAQDLLEAEWFGEKSIGSGSQRFLLGTGMRGDHQHRYPGSRFLTFEFPCEFTPI